MTKYNKPFLDISDQISLLKNRGLIFKDEGKAKFYLQNISYYHLSIYAKSFQTADNNFKRDTFFEDILDLYNFDKKLRLLILDLLERIEMSFKCVLAYEITKSKTDNYWYVNKNNYKNSEIIDKHLKSIKESKEIYIQHFYNKYPETDYPPAWMFFESLTFGECGYLASNLHNVDKQIIASFYKLPKRTVKMFYYLSHLRNICAHHSRVWNRKFTIKIGKNKKYDNIFKDLTKDSLFSYLVVMQIFLVKISPTSTWIERLKELIDEYNIPLYKMGFSDDWRDKLESIK